MLRIGINENVCIGKDTKVNEEKGWLELQLRQGVSMTDGEKMQAAFEGKEVKEDSVLKQVLFPPKTDAYEKGVKVGRKTVAQISIDIQKYMEYLSKFLGVYMTTDQINEEFGKLTFVKLTAAKTAEELKSFLEDEAKISKLYVAIYKELLKVLKKHNGIEPKVQTPENTFRLKLWRQKAANTFATIPTGFDIWIEPMNVPEPMVKVTAYDLTNFKNSTINRMSTEAPVADSVPPSSMDVATTLFADSELPF